MNRYLLVRGLASSCAMAILFISALVQNGCGVAVSKNGDDIEALHEVQYKIEKGVTTDEQLLTKLGPATMFKRGPNDSTIMMWISIRTTTNAGALLYNGIITLADPSLQKPDPVNTHSCMFQATIKDGIVTDYAITDAKGTDAVFE